VRIAGSLTAVLVLLATRLGAPDAWAFSQPESGAPSANAVMASLGSRGTSTLIRELPKGISPPEASLGPSLIHLGAGYTLDPASDNPERDLPQSFRALPPAGNERGYFLVQFRGAVTDEDRAAVEGLGGKIVGYIPDYTFLVSLPGSARERLASLARVAWVGLYQPAYKISTMAQMRESGPHSLIILLFPEESLVTTADAVRQAGGTIEETSDNGINRMLKVNLDLARLSQVAQIPAIAWIEPHQVPQWHNDQCQWVVQTRITNNRHLWDLGIKGQGQVVSVADTGIRTTHYQFFDSAVPISTFGDYPTHRKIIGYKKTVESTDITFGDDAANSYHGTHTSGTTAGDDAPNGTSTKDGMAINAKIFFLDGGGTAATGVFIPLDLNDLFILPYNGNTGGAARIMSNSWGNSNGGVYDLQSMAADQFMWNHPDFLLFFSNGNDGIANSVGSPATAKNVVSAGGTGDGASAGSIYSSTSRGPTDDLRIKPTICAPATLSSANGGSNTTYVSLSGTSMASPAMAGATVLLRQYLVDGWYPTGAAVPANSIPNPSAAMLKAMAINSADPDISGYTVPDNNVGWGRINDDNVCYFAGDQRRLALVDNAAGLLTGEYVEYQVYVADNAIPLKASLVWTDYPGTPAAAVELVNDLNLTATDGTSTYKANVYSAGQSVTGGTADSRNVEECVRRNAPTVGLWTFRVQAQNVPIGPQRFALVITGALASDAGIVTLDKVTYGAPANPGLRVVDSNAGSSVSVTFTSTTEPSGESVVLNGSGGVYAGTFPLSLAYPLFGDGALSVSDGDQITLTYQDANPTVTLTATASVNISGPAISDVHATALGESDATLSWTTTSASDSRVHYGTTPALGSQTGTAALITAHAVGLIGLSPNTLYYYDVESLDSQGNGVRDDNGGLHYTFSTDNSRDVLLVIGDASFTKKTYYQNAFARSGWTYSIWEGTQASTPYVGNLGAGMASYKAVVWQTGFEQYPMFTDAARDSITRFDLLGSRLAVYSQDVAWDFSDPTSPDYTAARKAWFENELKATWQVDPTTFSLVRGYAGDPISAGYTAGVSYTPTRDGGAGDEVNGIAAGGSFANVWKDNNTVADDIAIRWTSSANVGDPARAVWGGTPRKVSSNCYEWAQLNATTVDDVTRSDVLDKTLIWLVGHDHPSVAVTGPNGGEILAGNTVSIAWTEGTDTGYTVASRRIYYSDNGGDSWTLITSSAGPSPYSWDLSAIPNGIQYRVRVLLADSGAPALSASDGSNANVTINRPGGDTRGPVVLAGSIIVGPNPIVIPNPAVLSATLSDVYTGNSNLEAAEWSSGTSPAVPGSGSAMNGLFTTPLVTATAALDSSALHPGTETLWVRGRDAAGNWGNAVSLVIQVNAVLTAVDGLVPRRFALYQSSPNPFGPHTAIRLDVPRSGPVLLEIFDVNGRRLRTLVDGVLSPGPKALAWDGTDDGGRPVGSGVYFCRMHAGQFQATRKMTLLR
jgi:subtilisin family serine protease